MTIENPYLDSPPGTTDFGRASRVITPSDSADLPVVSKGLLVAATGDVVLVPVWNDDGDTVTITNAPAGMIIPYFCRRVMATGTDATLYTIEK